jgi:hypothetical protein
VCSSALLLLRLAAFLLCMLLLLLLCMMLLVSCCCCCSPFQQLIVNPLSSLQASSTSDRNDRTAASTPADAQQKAF